MTLKDYKPHFMTGAIVIAAGLVMHFEGKSNVTYYDPPKVLTLCYGHTGGIKPGQTATDQECIDFLKDDLDIAATAVDKLVRVPMPDKRRAAFISFTYNLGAGKFASSTMLKKLNAGDTLGACNTLLQWVYAGGKKLPGLVRRREAERELCLDGL